MTDLKDTDEIAELEAMIRRHAEYTHSEPAWKILASWEESVTKFAVVMPKDYKRMLDAMKRAEEGGLTGDEAVMEAFEENKNDLARVSGN